MSSRAEEELQQEFDELIVAQLTGEITAEQFARLEQLLADDNRLRRIYVETIHDAGVLRRVLHPSEPAAETITGDASDAVEQVEPAALKLQQKWQRWRRISWSVAGVVLLALLGVMSVVGPPYYRRLTRRDAFASGVVADLTGVDKAAWVDDRALPPGAPLAIGGRLQLKRGLVEVTFRRGAVVTLQGPCDFTLTAPDSGALQHGSLAAWVSQRASGFTIGTPSVSVVDLGTEFGVAVERDGATLVRVYQGRVQLQSGSQFEPRELTAGMSARSSPQGKVAFLPGIPPQEFVRRIAKFNNVAAGEIVAYKAAQGTLGVQNFDGALGMDFKVVRAIEMTRLGAFDSGGDGFSRPITVELWRRDDAGTPDVASDDRGHNIVASLQFTRDDGGQLAGSQRFRLLAQPLTLEPGDYTIVAHGYGVGELASNEGPDPTSRRFKSRSTGEGAIAFVGTSRYGNAGEFPTTADVNRNPQQYAAGTFAFRVLDK